MNIKDCIEREDKSKHLSFVFKGFLHCALNISAGFINSCAYYEYKVGGIDPGLVLVFYYSVQDEVVRVFGAAFTLLTTGPLCNFLSDDIHII